MLKLYDNSLGHQLGVRVEPRLARSGSSKVGLKSESGIVDTGPGWDLTGNWGN